MDFISWPELCSQKEVGGQPTKVITDGWFYKSEECTVSSSVLLGSPKHAAQHALEMAVNQPLEFSGNLRLMGKIVFKGRGRMPRPCLTVVGDLIIESGIIEFDGCFSENGPGAVSATRLVQRGGQVVFRRCIGVTGGGLFLEKGLEQLGGSLTFEECQATAGGGLFLLSSIPGQIGAHVDSNGTIAFRSCTATRAGGGLYAGEENIFCSSGLLQWTGGVATFSQCHAPDGGCLAGGGFLLRQTRLEFSKCRAEQGGKVKPNQFTGGAIAFCDMLELDHAVVHMSGCLSDGSGGAIGSYTCAGRTSSVTMQGGRLDVRNCHAEAGDGGGLFVKDLIFARSTAISVDGCVAQGSGGGAAAGSVDFLDVNVSFQRCDARAGAGGGLNVSGAWKTRGATAVFSSCTSAADGGCAAFGAIESRGTTMKVQKCTAGRNGGGIFIASRVSSSASEMEFQDCNARGRGGCVSLHGLDTVSEIMKFERCRAEFGDGGGLHVHGSWTGKDANVSFLDCKAGRNGGGAAAQNVEFDGFGKADFRKCQAAFSGGGLMLWTAGKIAVPMLFEHCSISETRRDVAGSAGLDARKNLELLRTVEFIDVGPLALSTADTLTISQMNVSTSSFQDMFEVEAGRLLAHEALDCSRLAECKFKAKTLPPMSEIQCSMTSGRASGHGSISCERCLEGMVRWNETCMACPTGAQQCEVNSLVLRAGTMVSLTNISHSLYCPNPSACPGGDVEGPLCLLGHQGPGCADCEEEYFRSDGSVLVCSKCDASSAGLGKQLLLMVGKSCAIFGLAAFSALSAKQEVKFSGVLLNQLMSFGTVAATILTAAMQTASATGTIDTLVTNFAENLVDLSSGSSSGVSHSSLCTVASLGLAPDLWKAQLLNILMPVLLVAALAVMKSGKLSLLIGINCFFPDFLASFGKYLVCYRLEEEGINSIYGLTCPFMPAGALGGVAVVCAVGLTGTLLFLVVRLWLWLSRHNPATADELPPSHVIFVTRAYKDKYKFWETERLLRKTLLKLFSQMLPVTYAPASQMASVSCVLLTSLVLYAWLLPYMDLKWNGAEVGLLVTASIMTSLTSCLLSNEAHWGRSAWMQWVLLMSIAMLAGGICLGVGFKFVSELMRERQERPQAEKPVELPSVDSAGEPDLQAQDGNETAPAQTDIP
ncbi:pmpB [Symbiodinium sp. CCMP2456]|nr:pmpB [Symbiodinium sp. CCMP2456]